jgi:hypothetical protein
MAKRRSAKTKPPPDVVRLYLALKEMRASVDDLSAARKLPGFYEGSVRLHHAMGLNHFWQEDIMMCDAPNPPGYVRHNNWRWEGWQKGWAARCELENAIRDVIISTDLSS